MTEPTPEQIEAAADAIKFLVSLDVRPGWTIKGMAETKWPSGFSTEEQKLLRIIAYVALRSALTTTPLGATEK